MSVGTGPWVTADAGPTGLMAVAGSAPGPDLRRPSGVGHGKERIAGSWFGSWGLSVRNAAGGDGLPGRFRRFEIRPLSIT